MVVCILDKKRNKSLLIIGAGVEQIPAYELAKKRGLTVIGTDINPDAPAFKIADYKLIASTRDPKKTLSVVKKFSKVHEIHGVITIANDVPLTVATISNAFKLPGITLDSAIKVSDKLLMKSEFKSHFVPTPWFTRVKNSKELERIVSLKKYDRFVLKPSDGRGARGVLLIDKNTDFKFAYSEAVKYGTSGKVILEEFIPGIQLSTESFLVNGRVFTPAISERNYEFLNLFYPNIIENGGTIPANLSNIQKKKIDELISEGAKALGVKNGIVKGDLVISLDGTIMIIELALRLSGGWLASHQIPAATGVNLIDAVISNAIGEKVFSKKLLPSKNFATAIRYWFPKEGRIKKISGEKSIKKLNGLLSYGFFRNVGDFQPKIKMHNDRFGYLIVHARSRKKVLSLVKKGLKTIKVNIE